MIPPEVPRGGAIGEAVFHHQPDSQRDDPRRVMAARWGEVSHVGIEVGVAGDAVVLGVSDLKAAWLVAEETAEIVQCAAT